MSQQRDVQVYVASGRSIRARPDARRSLCFARRVVIDDKPRPPDHIRALLDEVDRVRAEAEIETRRIERALQRPAFWPDRRHPRRWSNAEFGRDAHAADQRDSRD